MGILDTITRIAENPQTGLNNGPVIPVEEGLQAELNDQQDVASSAALKESRTLISELNSAGIPFGDYLTGSAIWAANFLEYDRGKSYPGMVANDADSAMDACCAEIGGALGSAVRKFTPLEKNTSGPMESLVAFVKGWPNAPAVAATSKFMANDIVEELWGLSGIAKAGVSRETVTAVIIYSVEQVVEQRPQDILDTDGHYVIGVLLTVLTGLLCAGELPKGYSS